MKKPIALLVGMATLLMCLPISIGAAPAEDAEVMDGKTLVTFGDSLTALSTWPQDVASALNMKLVNAGIGGNTSTDGMKRFDRDITSKNPDFVIIGFGTNDNVRPIAGNLNSQVSLADFRQNMTDFITKVRALGATPILDTCPYVREDAYGPASNYAADGGLLAVLDTYNAVIREVAAAENVGLIDIREECKKYELSQFLVSDGVHLSALGNQVYAQMITAYMKDHYNQDPTAPRVPLPVRPGVEEGNWTKDIISFDPADWLAPKEGDIKATKNTDGSISLANTTGFWPDIHYSPTLDKCIAIPVEGSTLNFDFTTDGAGTNIVLFFDGSTPTLAYSDSKSVSLTPAIKKAYPHVRGNEYDIDAGQKVTGSIKLSSVVPKNCIDENGNVLMSGVKVFAVGKANKPVTIRELSVTKGAYNPDPIESEMRLLANLLPTAEQNTITMNQGVVDFSYNQDGSLRLARAASSSIAWPSIAIALNQAVDLSDHPYLHMSMTTEGGAANGYIYYTDESGTEYNQQLTMMTSGVANDYTSDIDELINLTTIMGASGNITITKVILSVYGNAGDAVVWNDFALMHEVAITTTTPTTESTTNVSSTETSPTESTTGEPGATATTTAASGTTTTVTAASTTKSVKTGEGSLAVGALMMLAVAGGALVLTQKKK